MNMYKQQKRYPAQALAIAMLVLVISSLIGLSMYSRATKDRVLTMEERASAEALEISDILLNNVVNYTLEEIMEAVGVVNPEASEDSVMLKENSEDSQISDFFSVLGLFELQVAGSAISDLIDPICPIGMGSNEYQLTIEKTDRDTTFEVRPGHVWTFPTRKVAVGEGGDCFLNLYFSSIGDPLAGLVYTKIDCEYDEDSDLPTSCEDYTEGMMEKYRYISNGQTNPDFLDGVEAAGDSNWQDISPDGGDPTIVIDLSEDNIPSEIRIKALGRLGSPGIGISYSLEGDSCPAGLDMFRLRAGANCSEVYRGKEILIPQRGFNVLFDYVYFRGM